MFNTHKTYPFSIFFRYICLVRATCCSSFFHVFFLGAAATMGYDELIAPGRKMTVRRWTLLPLKLSRLSCMRWIPRIWRSARPPPVRSDVFRVDWKRGGGNSHILYFWNFHPYLGKWSNLTNIFQMGWNHQLGSLFFEVVLEGARLWEGWWYQLPHWFPHCKKLSSDASQITDVYEYMYLQTHIYTVYINILHTCTRMFTYTYHGCKST